MEKTWENCLSIEYEQPYFKSLKAFLSQEARQGYNIFPPKDLIMNAFRLTPLMETKVVIIGQDPYHGKGQAHGLAFSVQRGVKVPPSLMNIFKELETDCACPVPSHGDLTHWAEQGVLLLNTVLTVREGLAHAHANQGWEVFTDKAIRELSAHAPHPVVFLLWGTPAGRKESLIDKRRHMILKTVHPSPLSVYRGFFGCKHFSKTNELLVQFGLEPIDWCLPA